MSLIEIPMPDDHRHIYWMLMEFYTKRPQHPTESEWIKDSIIRDEFCKKVPPVMADAKKKLALDWLSKYGFIEVKEKETITFYQLTIFGKTLAEEIFKRLTLNKIEIQILAKRANFTNSKDYHGTVELYEIRELIDFIRKFDGIDKMNTITKYRHMATTILGAVSIFIEYLKFTQEIYLDAPNLFEIAEKLLNPIT